MLGALWITSTSADTTIVRCTVDTPPHPQVVQILFGVCAYILLQLVLYPTSTKYPADVFQLRQGEHISLVRDAKDGIHLLGRDKGNGCRNPTNLVLSLILRVSDNIHDWICWRSNKQYSGSVPWRHRVLSLKETELHRVNSFPEVKQRPINHSGTLLLLRLLQKWITTEVPRHIHPCLL